MTIKVQKNVREYAKIKFSALIFTGVIGVFIAACQPNQAILNSKPSAPPDAPPANAGKNFDSLENDVEAMRTADFDYIYVFRRKDGAVLTGEDKKFLKANSPASTNRFVLSDEDKAVIAGSKNRFAPENMQALGSYFVIENFSKPEVKIPSNTNSNTQINADRSSKL